jgi:hypothetical protein
MASIARITEDRVMREQRHARLQPICTALGVSAYPDSSTVWESVTHALVRQAFAKHLLVVSEDRAQLAPYDGAAPAARLTAMGAWAKLCPVSPRNAQLLRSRIPYLAPVVPARGPSIGTGDRLGLATPGHLAAIRGHDLFPVPAQQSIREMSRAGRTPQEVVDDAMWGVLQMGYREGYAADADHLRTPEHVARTEAAGFTMYTIDPSEWVDDTADGAAHDVLANRFAILPWELLASTPDECRRAYADREFLLRVEGATLRLAITAEEMLRAAVKYGRAVAHTATMYRCLVSRRARASFAFELSIDETAAPTSVAEHFFVASELQRLAVELDSFAPRFVGEFYKGVDYVGDLARFRTEFAKHVAVAQHFGGYKISLHSGSDKFKIYPIVAELAGDLVHVKTAGTSYLEALRIVAGAAPDLFREILAFARQSYSTDRNSYQVNADPARIASPETLHDEDLPAVLDEFDARQVCHVTFGSVLSAKTSDGQSLFRDRLLAVLQRNEDEYHHRLQNHFGRHISPFV